MDREDIGRRAEMLERLSNASTAGREFLRSVTKNAKKFVAVIQSDRIAFIPGHYAVAPIEQLQDLDQRQTIPSAEVHRALGELLGPVIGPGEPLYDVIDNAYVEFCRAAGDIPSSHHRHRTYWICRAAGD